MQEKTFNRILDVVGIIAILAFVASFLHATLTGAIALSKNFAVTWLSIYVFAVTLGIKGNLDAHKTNLNRFAVEWVIACTVGLLLTVIVLVYG